MCGKKFMTMSDSSYTYSSDYSYINWQFKVTPVDDTVKVTGTNIWCKPGTCSRRSGEIIKNEDGSYTVKIAVNILSKSEIAQANWTYDNITINGDRSWVNSAVWITGFYKDHQAPVINDITQTDQQSSNGWATIKQIGISGTEESSEIVGISITDKLTGKKLVDGAVVSVDNQKWTYTCTPALEGADDGRVYIVTVKDRLSNVATKEFTVYKTDGTAPQVESPLSYTDWTAKAKTITLTITDYGSGAPQASLGDQTHYQACTKTADGKYQITYTFSDDIIGIKNYDLYLKDALGNAAKVTLTVGNIDKNTYTITYNLDGGTASGLKTAYTVEDSFTLPQVSKVGYTFLGYVGSNGSDSQKTVTISKGTRGNLSYTAKWQNNHYTVTFNANPQQWQGQPTGTLTAYDTANLIIDSSGNISGVMSYNTQRFYGLSIGGAATGYNFDGFFDAPTGGDRIWNAPVNGGACMYEPGKYWDNSGNWIYDGNVTAYARWIPWKHTVKYNVNGGKGTYADGTKVTGQGYWISKTVPTREGFSFKEWNTAKDGKGNGFKPGQQYYSDQNGGTVTLYAQWTYNPLSVKVPQILVGDKSGSSSFRIKCDDIEVGNIKVNVPNSFSYKQNGKADVAATIIPKSSSNMITPSNKSVVYNISTNGLSAGCWNGSFNIRLTLTKE